MKKKIFVPMFAVSLLAAVVLVGSAFADSAQAVSVTLKEFTVTMSAKTVTAGVPVNLTIINEGTVVHEVVLEKAGVEDQALEINGEGAEAEDIQPGETRTVSWTITEPGQYQLACHKPGHYAGGMVQLFTVQAAGANPLAGGTPLLIVGGAIVVLGAAGAIGLQMMRRNKATPPPAA